MVNSFRWKRTIPRGKSGIELHFSRLSPITTLSGADFSQSPASLCDFSRL